MNWKELNKKVVILIVNNKIKKIMESKNFGEQYEVGDEDKNYIVSIITKRGFNKMLCTCKNVSLHPEGICSHKLATMMFCQRSLFK